MSIKPSTVAQLVQAIEAELARMKDELGRAKGPRKAELKKLIGEGKRALEKLKRHLQFNAVSFGSATASPLLINFAWVSSGLPENTPKRSDRVVPLLLMCGQS